MPATKCQHYNLRQHYLIIFLYFLLQILSLNIYAKTEGVDSRLPLWAINFKGQLSLNQKYFNRLIKRFEQQQIIGLEIIVADESDIDKSSQYGHAMLRFVDNNASMGDDIVLSFVAAIDDYKISNFKGVTGGYPVMPLYSSFRKQTQKYQKIENRSLKRSIIPVTGPMLERLMQQLKNINQELISNQLMQIKKMHKESIKLADKRGRKTYGKNEYRLIAYPHGVPALQSQGYAILKKQNSSGNILSNAKLNALLFKDILLSTLQEVFSEENQAQHSIIFLQGDTLFQIKLDPNTKLNYSSRLDISRDLAKLNERYPHKNFKTFPYFSRAEVPGKMGKKNLVIFNLPQHKTFNQYYNISKIKQILPLIQYHKSKPPFVETLGNYRFFDNNCSGVILKLFKQAGFPNSKFKWFKGRVPIKLTKYLARNLLNPYPPLKIDIFQSIQQELKIIFPQWQHYPNIATWPPSILRTFPYRLSPLKLVMLLNSQFQFDTKIVQLWQEKIKTSLAGKHFNFEQTYQIASVPAILYRNCSSKDCATLSRQRINAIWPAQAVAKAKKKFMRRKIHWKRFNQFPALIKHYILLGYLSAKKWETD